MRTAILTSTTVAVLSCMLAAPASGAGMGRPLQAPRAPVATTTTRTTAPAVTPSAGPTRSAQPTTLGPSHTGQPNQSCGSATAPDTPGQAAQAPGSAFNPSGKAGTVYAGEQPQNSRNTASVSQYDAACAHQR